MPSRRSVPISSGGGGLLRRDVGPAMRLTPRGYTRTG